MNRKTANHVSMLYLINAVSLQVETVWLHRLQFYSLLGSEMQSNKHWRQFLTNNLQYFTRSKRFHL